MIGSTCRLKTTDVSELLGCTTTDRQSVNCRGWSDLERLMDVFMVQPRSRSVERTTYSLEDSRTSSQMDISSGTFVYV